MQVSWDESVGRVGHRNVAKAITSMVGGFKTLNAAPV